MNHSSKKKDLWHIQNSTKTVSQSNIKIVKLNEMKKTEDLEWISHCTMFI